MARLPRIVPGCPTHHPTWQPALNAKTEIGCYCLMPHHVHLIAVPSDKDGLRKTFADAHRRYTSSIDARLRTTQHWWQGRSGSVVMDERHLFHAVCYVSLNPLRAKRVRQAQDWRWSSAAVHLSGKDNKPVKVCAPS